MKCGKCGDERGPFFRQNPTGQPGVWRCMGCSAPIDPDLARDTAVIEAILNKPTKH